MKSKSLRAPHCNVFQRKALAIGGTIALGFDSGARVRPAVRGVAGRPGTHDSTRAGFLRAAVRPCLPRTPQDIARRADAQRRASAATAASRHCTQRTLWQQAGFPASAPARHRRNVSIVNRAGQTADPGLPFANKAGLLAVLPEAVTGDAVPCTDGSAMLAAAARQLGLEHQGLNTLRGECRRGAGTSRTSTPTPAASRAGCNASGGVATSCLLNYLEWYRALDRNTRTGAQTTSLLALAIAA